PARVDGYDPAMLDTLCMTGEVGWSRLTSSVEVSRLVGSTPVALFLREHADAWHALRFGETDDPRSIESALSADALRVLEMLRTRGASFLHELLGVGVDCDPQKVAIGGAPKIATSAHGADSGVAALTELAAAGLAASDGFAGLRALVRAIGDRPATST